VPWLTEITITAIEPFADGASFGATGAYERVRGTYKGTLDPADARNKAIVNIAKAPRNAAGRVEYDGEFFILRPADSARGSGKILYDVVNRGRKGHAHALHGRGNRPRSPNPTIPKTLVTPGTAFCCAAATRWCGAASTPMRRAATTAVDELDIRHNGGAIERVIRDEIVPIPASRAPATKDAPKWRTMRLSHEAASLDQAQAKLTRAAPKPTPALKSRSAAGICQRTRDRTAAGRYQSRAGNDLRNSLSRQKPQGTGRRLRRDPRPDFVSAPRPKRQQSRAAGHQDCSGIW
jgi:hypothetical protein